MNKTKNKRGAWECNNIEELLRASGNCENKDMKLEDSVLNLFDYLKREIELIVSSYDPEKNTISYEATYKWNTEDIQKDTQQKEENKLKYFRKCAIYYLL